MIDPTIQADPPIVVPASPLSAQGESAIRSVLLIVGTVLVGHGVLSKDNWAIYSQALFGIALAVWPIVWGQLKARKQWGRLSVMEKHVPDSVAVKAGK